MVSVLALLAAFSPSLYGQARVYRIGVLGTNGPPVLDRTRQNCPLRGSLRWQAVVEGLREHGYVQGENLVIECRYTEGKEERALPLAIELVNHKVDLLLAVNTVSVRAAKQATSTIPIVMIGVINPAGHGLVASLARPGGNVTGPSDDPGPEIAGKYLQLLKEVAPHVSRVGVLEHLSDPPEPSFMWEAVKAAAPGMHINAQRYSVRNPEGLESALAAMTQARTEALVVLPSPFVTVNAGRIIEFAAQSHLPAVYPERPFVEAGGLLAYVVDQLSVARRTGYYVDEIFKGAKPADLPVEQPTRLDLVINLRAAKALGLTIPQTMLLRASEVIQ